VWRDDEDEVLRLVGEGVAPRRLLAHLLGTIERRNQTAANVLDVSTEEDEDSAAT
jgi:hypothetical protein